MFQSLLETEAEEASKTSQSPLTNIRKKHHILTPRQSERTLIGIVEPTTSKMRPKSKLGGIGIHNLNNTQNRNKIYKEVMFTMVKNNVL